MAKIPGMQAKNIKVEYMYFHGLSFASPLPNHHANNAAMGKVKKNIMINEGFAAHCSRNSCSVMEIEL